MYDITIYANVAVPVYYTVLYYHMCGTMYHIYIEYNLVYHYRICLLSCTLAWGMLSIG
jgi:hypothetical protein